MGKLRTIYLALLNRQEKIVKKEEIVRIITQYDKEIDKVSINDALWYLARRNYVKRIFLDYYYINSIEERERKICRYEDKELLFEVLNRSNLKWYLGLSSARYTFGEIWQVPNVLTIINNRISGQRKILGMKIHFIKIKENLIFGLKKDKTEKGVKYFYSDSKKTNLDFVYLKESSKIMNDSKTKEYLKKYPKWLQKLT